MQGKRLGRSPTFFTSNAEMHSASLPINSVAMLGRDLVQREANESHILAGACYVHNLFGAACGSNEFTLGDHHCLMAKGFKKGTTGFCLMRAEDKAQCSSTTCLERQVDWIKRGTLRCTVNAW
jgi:hypothetical protein